MPELFSENTTVLSYNTYYILSVENFFVLFFKFYFTTADADQHARRSSPVVSFRIYPRTATAHYRVAAAGLYARKLSSERAPRIFSAIRTVPRTECVFYNTSTGPAHAARTTRTGINIK